MKSQNNSMSPNQMTNHSSYTMPNSNNSQNSMIPNTTSATGSNPTSSVYLSNTPSASYLNGTIHSPNYFSPGPPNPYQSQEMPTPNNLSHLYSNIDQAYFNRSQYSTSNQYEMFNGGTNQPDIVAKNSSLESPASSSSSSSPMNVKLNLDQGPELYTNELYSTTSSNQKPKSNKSAHFSKTYNSNSYPNSTNYTDAQSHQPSNSLMTDQATTSGSNYYYDSSSYQNPYWSSAQSSSSFAYPNLQYPIAGSSTAPYSSNSSSSYSDQNHSQKSFSTNNSSSSQATFASNFDPNYKQNLPTLINLIVKEVEAKKQLIRKVQNDANEIKKHLIDLIKSVFQLLVTNLSLDRANYNLELKNSIRNLNDLKRHVLIAYSCLIENTDNQDLAIPDLSPGDLNVINMLVKIHQTNSKTNKKPLTPSNQYYSKTTAINPIMGVDDIIDFGSPFVESPSVPSQSNSWPQNYYMGYSSNPSYHSIKAEPLQNSANYSYLGDVLESTNSPKVESNDAYSRKICDNLNDVKCFHFILIMFSSLVNLRDFMRDCNNNMLSRPTSSSSGQVNIDVEYIQKLILELIDQICHNDVLRTKILLSVSEIDDSI